MSRDMGRHARDLRETTREWVYENGCAGHKDGLFGSASPRILLMNALPRLALN